MSQRRWLELIKDYELEVHYHPGKTNVVADTLSRKHRCNNITVQPHSSYGDSEEPSLWVIPNGRLNNIALIPTIKEDVIAAQRTDVGMGHLHRRLELREAQYFRHDVDRVLWFKNRLMVPKDFELHRKIMDEAHCSWYSIHSGTNKMYQDLKKNFWWTRKKREIENYVSECDTYRRVKVDHLRPTENLQPLSIPEWKWEDICIEFIVGLSRTSRGYNSIWVIMDLLTKSAHFIPVSTAYRVRQYVELYMSHVVCYHGILKTIISDRVSIFVARFWEQLYECLDTHIIWSLTYHPQTDGQTKRVNQIIEDILRAYVLTDGPKWDKHLPLAKFPYNNSYQESIKMSPFEALYGWPYRAPLSWSESGERVIFGLDIVTEAEEKVKQIQANILAVQSCQKSYDDKRHNLLEFKVGDHVYFRISPMKGVRRFGIKEKLAPRYISPYPIIDKYEPTSYQVELPVNLSGVHNVFHVSQLKRCLKPPTEVVIEDNILLEPDLKYKAYPIKVLVQQDRVTCNKTTQFYMVQ
jgi:hypothetical protein